jgi:arsenate reductase-like glutaredoxin family protein
LLEKKTGFEERDLTKNPLTTDELDQLIGHRPHTDYLNTRNALYRSMNMRLAPPTRPQALALMATEPNLIRRPILIRGKKQVLGFDVAEMTQFLKP